MTNVHFSSKTDLWATPNAFFDVVNAEFQLNLDVCATSENAKCDRYFTTQENGLEQDWTNARCWMNPPYGKEIGAWVAKAQMTAEANGFVVGLLPARTDTKWWHEHVQGKAEVRFIKGRLKFGNSKNPAPFPSALVIWGKR